MSHNLGSEVLEALGQLLKKEIDYNVIIYIGEEPNFKEFHAHSAILRCRSEYFNKLFSNTENIEKKDDKYLIKKPNITPEVFDVILNYFYGQIDITNKTGNELCDIMITSDELELKKLTKLTEDFIVENHHKFLQNDPIGILQIIYNRNSLFNLQEACLEEICSKPKILFNTDKFTKLPAPLLEIILKRDDLNLNEIEIWENLIKWGLAQEQSLNNQHISKWNKDNIDTFKRILYKFIPLIKFYEISTEDYFEKVKPYEKVLSKELRDDILKFYMVPGYKPIYTPRSPRCNIDIDSTIINQKGQEYITLFANWIDKNESTKCSSKTIPYEFNLLYRASRDGDTAEAFHGECDNKGATITVVKIKDSEQIVGGYNPLFWDSSNTYKSTKDSLIFSFTNVANIGTSEMVYSNADTYSIQCYSSCGPVFGRNNLYVNYDNENYDNDYDCGVTWYSGGGGSYPRINMPNRFNIDDYEVFQVIKKK